MIPATKPKPRKPRKVKRPPVGTRAENLINEDPKAIAGRVTKALAACITRIRPDLDTLMAADGGMEVAVERLRAHLDEFEEELKGSVAYLSESLA